MVNLLFPKCRPLVLGAFLIGAPLSLTHDTGPTAVMGWWHGTSICVRASWNAACNDEQVLYEFVPAPPDSNHSMMHAYKIVQGKSDPMGDLEFTYSSSRAKWEADFANSRVNIQWVFELHGDSLVGQLLIRPDMRVGRNVVARRGKAAS